MNKENIRLLITGGSGFIGTNLVDFYKDKVDVLNIDIKEPKNKSHYNFWRKIDINDYDMILKVIKDFEPNIVIHMAARTDLEGKTLEDYQTNIDGVKNLIKVTNIIDSVDKVIFASSRLVCEIGYKPCNETDYKPTTLYGESKVIGEKLVRENKDYKKKWVIIRPTSIWGPWFDVPYKNFFDLIKRKMYFHPANLKIYKLFGYVENSVYIIDKLIKNDDLDFKTIYLSDFEPLEVKKWANMISNEMHGENVKEIPLFVLKTLARVGDVLKKIGYNNPPLTTFRLNNLLTNMIYNVDEVKKFVGDLPFSFQDGVKRTVKWMEKYEKK